MPDETITPKGALAPEDAYTKLRDFVAAFEGWTKQAQQDFIEGSWSYRQQKLIDFGFDPNWISQLAEDARVVVSLEKAQNSGIGYWLW
jgi:hypothetical protein